MADYFLVVFGIIEVWALHVKFKSKRLYSFIGDCEKHIFWLQWRSNASRAHLESSCKRQARLRLKLGIKIGSKYTHYYSILKGMMI